MRRFLSLWPVFSVLILPIWSVKLKSSRDEMMSSMGNQGYDDDLMPRFSMGPTPRYFDLLLESEKEDDRLEQSIDESESLGREFFKTETKSSHFRTGNPESSSMLRVSQRKSSSSTPLDMNFSVVASDNPFRTGNRKSAEVDLLETETEEDLELFHESSRVLPSRSSSSLYGMSTETINRKKANALKLSEVEDDNPFQDKPQKRYSFDQKNSARFNHLSSNTDSSEKSALQGAPVRKSYITEQSALLESKKPEQKQSSLFKTSSISENHERATRFARFDASSSDRAEMLFEESKTTTITNMEDQTGVELNTDITLLAAEVDGEEYAHKADSDDLDSDGDELINDRDADVDRDADADADADTDSDDVSASIASFDKYCGGCSDAHGHCYQGACYCQNGWVGSDCSETVDDFEDGFSDGQCILAAVLTGIVAFGGGGFYFYKQFKSGSGGSGGRGGGGSYSSVPRNDQPRSGNLQGSNDRRYLRMLDQNDV